MGKGDKRTRRGKIYTGSHGKARPHKARTKVTDNSVTKGTTRRRTTRRK